MKSLLTFSLILIISMATSINAQNQFESDVIKTSAGELKMTFIKHGTLMFDFNDLVIHIDPVSGYADYTKLPDADVLLITHHHGDHLDPRAIDAIKKKDTDIFCSESCLDQVEGKVMKNGDITSARGIKIEAVPAYNIVHKRNNGEPYHPKGVGNGYVLTFGNTRVYIGGDTENIPEMKDIQDIDIAFLPMNVPYTMTPQMVVNAADMLKPEILYPYHYGDTNVNELVELMKNKKTEVRIRQLQ